MGWNTKKEQVPQGTRNRKSLERPHNYLETYNLPGIIVTVSCDPSFCDKAVSYTPYMSKAKLFSSLPSSPTSPTSQLCNNIHTPRDIFILNSRPDGFRHGSPHTLLVALPHHCSTAHAQTLFSCPAHFAPPPTSSYPAYRAWIPS